MLKEGRGVLCAPITMQRCSELGLDKQVITNTSLLGTPFTITIDKIDGCSTGVSTHDRAATIRRIGRSGFNARDSSADRDNINPLYAQDKGVLKRAGHTEAAIDMARLAGLYPAAALIEIMNEDGTMARMPQLLEKAGNSVSKSSLYVISSPTVSNRNLSSRKGRKSICLPHTDISD